MMNKIMNLPSRKIKNARTFSFNEKEREIMRLERIRDLKIKEMSLLETEEKRVMRKKEKLKKLEDLERVT